MRNLKKVLSLVLCVAMMLSVMVMSTGATSFTDQEDFSENYAEAAEVLTGMGVINGYEDDSFKPQQSITRAEVAAMIYRVATGDVEDEKADINAGAKLFTDVNADDWFAGYVNYCGDAEYIKGYEDDSFRASNNVTGYEVLAMILRAVGYDKNKEFTGPTWTINVASTATELGMLENLDNSVNLAEPATREVVAELIFRAIVPGVPTVNYVPAIGDYLPDTWGHSLGEQVFKLELDPNTTDDWGRPNDTWKYNTGDEKTVIEEEALAVYTTAVVQCDVADETGVSGNDIPAVVNGQKTTVDINENATKATIGEQGRLTEVYEDCVVMIDTFLAQVTDVVASETDGNGHLDRLALLELTVYNSYKNGTEVVYMTADSDWDYAEGDMLLVNAYTDSASTFGIASAYQEVEGYVKDYNVATYVDIVADATSFVGAQTEDWVNAHKHVIDGETYMDAFRFALDQTFNVTDEFDETINYNWWLDQYGNIIGVTPLDRTGYAVMKDFIWVNGGRDGGHAEATLVYMDGTEDVVTVNTIDGDYFENNPYWAVNDATPELDDSHYGDISRFSFFGGNANVSSDSANNNFYDGYALYQVYTNDDGTVKLEGTRLGNTLVAYADNATIDVNKSTISANGSVVARFDGSTQFIVNNGDGTYSAYTRDTLPAFAANSLDVFWSNDGTYASSVYIKSSTLFAEAGTHLFTTTDASYRVVGGGVHVIDAVVDGVERTIRTTDDDVINTLMENEGKLFHVTFETEVDNDDDIYGYVTDVALVNEFHDESSCPVTATAECNYTFAVNVIAGTDTVTIIERDGTRESWNTTNATTIVDLDGTIVDYNIETIEQAVENLSVGIWVVEDENGAAAQIYIGTRLSVDTGLNVSSTTEGAVVAYDAASKTYTITLPEDVTRGNMTVSAGKNAVLITDGWTGVNDVYSEDKTVSVGNDGNRSFTVWAEDGISTETYLVKIVATNNWTNIFEDVINSFDNVEMISGPIAGWRTPELAVANREDLDVGTASVMKFPTTASSNANSINWRVYTSTAEAAGATANDVGTGMTNNELPVTVVNDSNILLVKVGDTNGDFWYTAFEIQK